ncbi:hypothetical protein [Gaiella sp.]|uniref:hypothetical protein n=1 Tax=Gaiella sp. TaxID=2663207 RepID=UPI002E326690|nr:hypothetical protein [Gaiella sp.]HEX5582518.1 hypothetical protein [Gaiella sp.]
MSTTATRTTPRLLRNTRRPNADELVHLLPAGLSELVANDEAAVAHARVATSYSDARTRVVALSIAREKALVDDEREQQAAILAGRKAKPPKAAKIETELEGARRELDAATGLLDQTAVDLLIAAVPHVRRAVDDASERETRALDEAESCLRAALSAFEDAAVANQELNWLRSLAATGEVHPVRAGRPAVGWKAYRETRAALDRLTLERERSLERAEDAEHADEAANSVTVAGHTRRLDPPPGTEVWQLPEPAETT